MLQNGMAIKNRLKEFIAEQGMKRSEFIRRTGLPRNTVYVLCRNENQLPDSGTLNLICSTFKIQPGVLMEWVPDDEGAA